MEGKMKCAIYYGIKNVKMEERDIPKIGSKDVLVKVLRAGICGSDTGAYLHGGEPYGIFKGQEFGHEMVGRIVEKGADVPDCFQLDDIVFIDPMKASRLGSFKADMTGGFSEYVRVEDAALNVNLYILDKNVDLDTAALIEPVSVGTQGATWMNPYVDQNVVVLGAGTIGLGATAGLLSRGIKNVIVVDKVQWRLDKAKELGAKIINTSEDNLEEKLLEYCGEVSNGAAFRPEDLNPDLLQQVMEFAKKSHLSLGKKIPNVDYYIDAAGAVPLLQQVFSLGKFGTKYSIVAVYGKEIPLSGNMFIANEAMIRGSKGYNTNTIQEVIQMIKKNDIPVKTMITKKYSHKDFPQAIEAASDVTKNIKVIIDYEM